MGRNSQQTTRWSNWAGNQQTGTVLLSKPQTESELQQVVQSAQASGRRVKAVGSGHSFTAIAVSEEVLVDLSDYDEIVAIDKINQTVTVQSGIQLSKLNQALLRKLAGDAKLR